MSAQIPPWVWDKARTLSVWIALTVGAWPFVALAYLRPVQFVVVLKESVSLFWPFALAVALTTLASSLCYWILWSGFGLSRWRAMLIATMPLSLLVCAADSGCASKGAIACSAAGLVFLAWLAWRLPRIAQTSGSALPFASPWAGAMTAILLYVLLTYSSMNSPIRFARELGSLSIVTAFVGLCAVMAVFFSQRPRVAVASLIYLIVAAIFLPPNDHHIP